METYLNLRNEPRKLQNEMEKGSAKVRRHGNENNQTEREVVMEVIPRQKAEKIWKLNGEKYKLKKEIKGNVRVIKGIISEKSHTEG